jgi:hypothetical protein
MVTVLLEELRLLHLTVLLKACSIEKNVSVASEFLLIMNY